MDRRAGSSRARAVPQERALNAVAYIARRLAPEALRRLAALRVRRFDRSYAPMLVGDGGRGAPRPLTVDEARDRVVARWADDLCGLLNAMTREELAACAREVGAPRAGRSPELRVALWDFGAALERGYAEVSLALQPRPVVLGGHLVVQLPPRGLYPPSAVYPRPIPDDIPPRPPADEPDTVDELLAAADRAIGVRLGRRGRDKGAWGMRASLLLGVVERGLDEPDWRGDVEVKTVPVAQQPDGLWRVVEDPAIAMVEQGGGIAKLQRTLWLARADLDDGEATIVSWYLLDWDEAIAALAKRYLHERPKGPAGTLLRGLYLHKRFFAESGFLATLNGLPSTPAGTAP